jgi:hypothetical protein
MDAALDPTRKQKRRRHLFIDTAIETVCGLKVSNHLETMLALNKGSDGRDTDLFEP